MKSALTHRLPLLLAGCAAATLLATGTATADTGSSGSSSGSAVAVLAPFECAALGLHWDPAAQACKPGLPQAG